MFHVISGAPILKCWSPLFTLRSSSKHMPFIILTYIHHHQEERAHIAWSSFLKDLSSSFLTLSPLSPQLLQSSTGPSGTLDQLLERFPMSSPLWMLSPSCSTWNLTAKVNIFPTLPSSGDHFLTRSLSTTRPRGGVVSFLLLIAILDHYHLLSLPLTPSSESYAISIFHTHPSEQ